MNTLKIWNSLLRDCNRSVFSISGDAWSHAIIDVNTTRFYQKLSKSLECTISVCPKHEKTMLSMKTFVYSNSNKMNALCKSRGHQGYGLFYHRSSILKVSSNNSTNHKSIRHFSDASNTSVNIPTMVLPEGFWKNLSESTTVEFCQNGFVMLHTATGLPWWATIILATWGIRSVVTVPLALYQSYIFAKVDNLKFEMNDIVKDLKMETNFAVHKFKWTEDYARKMYNRSLKKQWQNLIERENCHPMKSAVLLLVQIPMWIALSTSLRNLCYMLPHPTERAHEIYFELVTGGFGWITNLAAIDPYFATPVTLGLLNLTIIEMQNLMRSKKPSRTQKYLTNFFRLLAVGMVPLASYVPAGMSLYWASSSAFGIIQNLLLMSPRVRRLAKIPPTDNELEKPYKHLYENFRQRIGLEDILLSNTVKK